MNSRWNYRDLYYQALRIRMVEEEIIKIYSSDKVQSPVHLSIGQEAVAVGLCAVLTEQDMLFSTYRSHAFYLAKGGDLKQMMAELFGRLDGCCSGKGGSMHLSFPQVGFMGTSAVVASGIPNAVGAAFAEKMLGRGNLTLAVFGDGATEEGVYHESLNFASLHRLPIIFICENNQFAVHSRQHERQSYSLRKHVEAYAIETHHISQGFDFCEVASAFSDICNDFKESPRPIFIEVDTCRYMEHVGTGEDFYGGYRSAAEQAEWKRQDPLIKDEALKAELAPQIAIEINESIAFAEASPLPSYADVLKHVL